MEKKAFTWIPFYKELASRLIELKNSKDVILKAISKAYDDAGFKYPLERKLPDGTIKRAIDIDPFTFYGIINRSRTAISNKLKVLENLKHSLSLHSEVPTDLDGVPTRMPLRAWFVGWEIYDRDSGNANVDLLWEFFEVAVKFADGDDSQRNKFNHLFVECNKINNVGWGLTFGLYWIRPDFYLGFDENTRNYLLQKGVIDKQIIDSIQKELGLYLEVCSNIKSNYKKIEPSINSFYEISSVAWIYAESKAEQKKSRIKSDWAPFYKELSKRLLDFVNNREELLEKLKFQNILGKRLYKTLADEEGNLVDIDPFTIFALANRGSWPNKKLLEQYKDALELSCDIPNKFDGVALLVNPVFYNRLEKRGPNDIDNLWELFKASLIYAEEQGEESKEEFIKWFDIVIKQGAVGSYNLTKGLYWFEPSVFVCLDGNTIDYIYNSGQVPSDIKTLSSIEKYKGLKGSDYINIIERLTEVAKIEDSPFEDFVELYHISYHYAKNSEKKGQYEEFILNETSIINEAEPEIILDANITPGHNTIYYGLPGCGKSYMVDKLTEKVEEKNKFRVTFHQDYSYSDFIGQIMPVIGEDGRLTYDFKAGPFTLAIEKALKTNTNVYLIIEEINRGNAPSIFGDTFQLLDRDDKGKSEYPITHSEVIKYINSSLMKEKLYIPQNLIILATMNTSDQNVFTLDTAFKRRWDFEEVTNNYTDDDHPYELVYVPGTNVSWTRFYETLNKRIINKADSNFGFEDKRIGAFFIKKASLSKIPNENNPKKAKRFAHKMIEYLWNDVAKFDKSKIFSSDYQTLSDAIQGFLEPGNPLKIFSFNFADGN